MKRRTCKEIRGEKEKRRIIEKTTQKDNGQNKNKRRNNSS